jgi:hypothetical protein
MCSLVQKWHMNLLSGCFFPLGFPTKILRAYLFSSMRSTCLVHFIFPYLTTHLLFGGGGGVQVMKLLIMQFSLFQISSSAPYSQHPQPMFFPQCNRPSFSPIQNNRQKYGSNANINYKTSNLRKIQLFWDVTLCKSTKLSLVCHKEKRLSHIWDVTQRRLVVSY